MYDFTCSRSGFYDRSQRSYFAGCEPDKPDRHKDGSGHHHPMGVFPIEHQVQH
jgi:hypothetical protein